MNIDNSFLHTETNFKRMIFSLSLTALGCLLSNSNAFAVTCSHNKLDLNYCGTPSKPAPTPIYHPVIDKEPKLPLPNPSPTVVTAHDSRGKTIYGPGITIKH
jgi:hypothetical protein